MRTLKLAGLAAVGVAALTACSNVQGAAVFVDDERVPEDTVDAYVDELATLRTEASGMDLVGYDYSLDRELVVEVVVITELGRTLDLENPEGGDDSIEAKYAERNAYINALMQDVEPRELTQDEIDAITVAAQQDQQIADTIQQQPEVFNYYAALSDELAGYVEEYDVAASPRYGEVAITLIPGVFEVEVPQR
ncbi:hypothetical protein [Glycomyces tarimensis]